MRILLSTYFYLPHVGGLSTYVDTLKQGLEQLGHEVDVFAHHPDMAHYYMSNNGRKLKKSLIEERVHGQLSAYYEQHMPHVEHWIRWRDIERYCFEIAAASFGLESYDLIHTQDIVSTRALWRVKPKKTPLVATIHGCIATEFLHNGEVTGKNTLAWKYAAAEELYGATSSHATVVPSRWLQQLMVSDFGIPNRHVKVMPYGIDVDAFMARTQQPTEISAAEGTKVIVCPARLVPVKGHKYLIDALARLKQDRTDWVCWLLGNGPLKEELQQQTQRLGLQEHVLFLGDRADVPALLKKSDIFALASLQDNLPFSVMEAQLAGTPVVTAGAGGIPEMVQHGKTGFICLPGQSNALYIHLKRLLDNPGLRAQMSKQAQEWATEYWSMSRMMTETMELYEEVTNQPS